MPATKASGRALYVWFVYVSLAFVAVYLYRADYFVAPAVRSYPFLALSLVLLYAGLVADALGWRRLLKLHGIGASPSESAISAGLSIFGKYIPGKLWIIVGRASYIAAECEVPLGRAAIAALQAQGLVILIGLVASVPATLALDAPPGWSVAIVSSFCLLALVLFSDRLSATGTRLLERIAPRKRLRIPHIGLADGVSVIPWVVAMWALMSFGFYCLILALSPVAPALGIFAFPFAATVGMLAVVVPGGLGVREGILALCLVGYGLPVVDATSVSVFARLWFLAGESAFFCTALALSKRRRASQLT